MVRAEEVPVSYSTVLYCVTQDRGNDANFRSNDADASQYGDMALGLARRKGHDKVVEALRKAGAK